MPATPGPENSDPPNLPDRVQKYREVIERVVGEVGEHRDYEMKRECALQNLGEKIEFVKDIQSIATSRIDSERYLVIGADEKTKALIQVTNHGDFDEANLRKILDRYLAPVPVFEVFQLDSATGVRFVLIVIRKQPHRRIIAKATVTSEDGKKLLLREGDLWTKGASTSKHLATADDWNDIIQEEIEAEAERRAQSRTKHMIELALAREQVKPGDRSLLPSVLTDDKFQALMEELCGRNDAAAFTILLERLRDESVEGWNDLNAFEVMQPMGPDDFAKFWAALQNFIVNVFRPTMRWVTLAGIFVVRSKGPIAFLEALADLLQEIFEMTHKLFRLRALGGQGQWVKTFDEHVSHTVPALESLIALHLIGGYIAKRGRWEYFKTLFRPVVAHTLWEPGSSVTKRPMAFWPINISYGEPEALGAWGGRLKLCAARAMNDVVLRKIFGSERAAIDALSEYEFCLELNSFLGLAYLSKETAAIVERQHPGIGYEFYPSFIQFPLVSIHALAASMLQEVKLGTPRLLRQVVVDPQVLELVAHPKSTVFADFLFSVAKQHGETYVSQRRFTPFSSAWPTAISDELKRIEEHRRFSEGKM